MSRMSDLGHDLACPSSAFPSCRHQTSVVMMAPPLPKTKPVAAEAVTNSATRELSRTTGTVTASGLFTWKRQPKRQSPHGHHENLKRRPGMGMQATPARKKKARTGSKGSIGMHSTPRAGAYSRASRTVLTTPSRPARLGEDSDLTSTSSLPVSSMADPSDTGFFAPPAINASPSFRCGSGEEIPQTAEFDLTAKPKLFHTARAPNIDCSYSTDGQHSVTRSAGGETLFPGLEEVIVPVNFATSSFTSRSSGDEGYRYRDTLATIKPGSSSGSEMTGRSFHDQSAVHAKRMDQHQSITHEDFSVPLNDSTQRSEHSASSRGPSRSTGNGMKRSVATSDMQSSRTTSGKFRSKTPIVQRATSAGRWIPQGGSSVHGRPSTPYRQNTHTRSVPFEPVSSQSDLPGSSTDEVRQNEGSHGHLRTDEEAISDRAEELPDGSQLPTCGRLLISNQRLIGTSQVGLEDSSDIFSSVEEARGRSQMVQDGGSKRNEALAQIWNVSDWGAPFAQRPLDNFGFPSPGVDDVVEMSSLVRESVQPERFVLSSQLDGDMPHARSSSPLAFSSSNSSSGYSKTRTPTAETHCQRRRYGYTPSLVTLPDEDESGGLRGVWRGAEVLARMEGEGEGEDAQHADEEKVGIDKATKACKGKRREPALDGGIDLEGEAEQARQRRLTYFRDLDMNYRLRVEYVRLLRG